MMVTLSNGRTKARGRGIAAVLALATAMLLPGSGLGTLAHAQSPIEAPPVLRASELAPPDLLKGPTFVVDDQVPIQGMLGQFTIRADVGTFEAHGRELLRIRVGELHALAQLERMSKSEEFLKAAGRAVARPVESTAQMLLHPVETAKGMPGGVERFFGRVELGVQTIAGATSDPGQSSAQRAEDVTKRVGGLTADVFGYESERRALAKSLGVDPYTTNAVLAKQLSDMAWVAFSGRVGVNTLISVFVPVSIAISAASVTNSMIYDTPAADLINRNEQKLLGMGASEQQARALIKNQWYSLSVLTSLVTALDRLSGIDGRPAVVALAVTVSTEDQARFLASAVEMLAAHHQTVEPLAEVVARGTVIGRTQSGALLVPGAVDYVAWTEQVAGFGGRTDLQGAPGSLWITGRMSPEAQRQFAALGWTVHQNVLPPWQR
ncbi:MAG: hypothetical protein ACRERE_28510 [Candidatus Entotheonellia bacterium]